MEVEKTTDEKQKWFDKIKEGLLEHKVSLEEFLTIYKYTGGDGNRWKDDDDRNSQQCAHIAYWTQTRGLWSQYPEWVDKCICGHWVKENCYVVNINDYDKLIPLGNCCIKQFLGDKSGRTCGKCEAPHVNRKYNLCNKCKPQAGWNKCEKCYELCRKPNELCRTHLRLKILEEHRNQEKIDEERRLKQKIEMEQRRQSISTMSDTDTDTKEEIERKCACGKVLTGSYKKCYNCYNGIDPNATHPCETCEKPVKGTYKNCYLCNQKLRQEKG